MSSHQAIAGDSSMEAFASGTGFKGGLAGGLRLGDRVTSIPRDGSMLDVSAWGSFPRILMWFDLVGFSGKVMLCTQGLQSLVWARYCCSDCCCGCLRSWLRFLMAICLESS